MSEVHSEPCNQNLPSQNEKMPNYLTLNISNPLNLMLSCYIAFLSNMNPIVDLFSPKKRSKGQRKFEVVWTFGNKIFLSLFRKVIAIAIAKN